MQTLIIPKQRSVRRNRLFRLDLLRIRLRMHVFERVLLAMPARHRQQLELELIRRSNDSHIVQGHQQCHIVRGLLERRHNLGQGHRNSNGGLHDRQLQRKSLLGCPAVGQFVLCV